MPKFNRFWMYSKSCTVFFLAVLCLWGGDTVITIIHDQSLLPGRFGLGPLPCSEAIGDPISACSGNMYYKITDVVIDADFDQLLTFTRSYNSGGRAKTNPGSLGPRWLHNLAYRIIEDSLGWVTLIEGTGRHVFFKNFQGPTDLSYRLVYDDESGCYSVIIPDNQVLVFRPDGLLSEMRDRDYCRIRLTYDDGRLVRATDAAGRYLAFTYIDTDRIHTVSLADGTRFLTFDYDQSEGAPLKKVTYADGSWEAYEYGTRGSYKALMVRRCTSDGVCQYYDYDIMTRATANFGNDSVNLVTISYTTKVLGLQGRTLYCATERGEDTVFYESEFCAETGRRKLISKSSISNRIPDSQYDYDQSGRDMATRAAESTIDSLVYDSMGRETFRSTQVDRSGMRMNSTRAFQPSRFTLDAEVSTTWNGSDDTTVARYEYDDKGNVTAITGFAMNPYSGVTAEKVTMAYNDRGQIIRFDGPNIGDIDLITFTYYDHGDLKARCLSNGNVVEYGPRDALGNVTLMRDGDDSRLDFQYDKRGRLSTITYTDPQGQKESMSYEYNYASDPVKTTFPDGSVIEYTYDNHGWLVEVNDSDVGHTIYSYDSYGHVRDSLCLSPAGDTLIAPSLQTR